MPTVVIEHESRTWIREGLTIVLDGRERGALEPGSKTDVFVEPGRHQIWLASKIATSPVVSFNADAREEYGFVCHTSGLVNRRITLQPAYVRKPTNRFDAARAHDSRHDPQRTTSFGKDGAEWAQVLGVRPDAAPDEIRRAYLKLIGVYHPDRVGRLPHVDQRLAGEEARRINLAYQAAKNIGMQAR
jgi:hypothetical protein